MSIPASAFLLQQLCAIYLRPVADWDYTNPAAPTPIFKPPLTSAEQATLTDLQHMANFGLSSNISLAEYQAFKSDAATAKNYLGLTSPTNAQTVAALKSVIRVLGALLRS